MGRIGEAFDTGGLQPAQLGFGTSLDAEGFATGMSLYTDGDVPMTICVIKPDSIIGGTSAAIVQTLEKHGFVLLQQDMAMMTQTHARTLYKEHTEEPYFAALITFMTSAPSLSILMTHQRHMTVDPVAELVKLTGPTNSEKARVDQPDSLRAVYGTDGMRNAVHAPADREQAMHAINTLFPFAMEQYGADMSTSEQPTDELVEVISAGLAELCRVKPPNPTERLAERVIANRDPRKRERRRLAQTRRTR